jgi:hypothetical protein
MTYVPNVYPTTIDGGATIVWRCGIVNILIFVAVAVL